MARCQRGNGTLSLYCTLYFRTVSPKLPSTHHKQMPQSIIFYHFTTARIRKISDVLLPSSSTRGIWRGALEGHKRCLYPRLFGIVVTIGVATDNIAYFIQAVLANSMSPIIAELSKSIARTTRCRRRQWAQVGSNLTRVSLLLLHDNITLFLVSCLYGTSNIATIVRDRPTAGNTGSRAR